MRLKQGHLALAVMIFIVIGTMLGLIGQQRLELNPLDVGERKQNLDLPSQSSKPASKAPRETEPSMPAASVEKLTSESPTPQHSLSRTETAIHFAADAAIQEARYEHASNLLQELKTVAGARVDPRVLFKLGLCRETLGQSEAALENYQRCLDQSHSPTLRGAARLGKARVLLAQGQSKAARDDLYSLLLQQEELQSGPMQARLIHQLATCSTDFSLRGSGSVDDLSQQTIFIPLEEIAVEEVIAELIHSQSHSPKMPAESEGIRLRLRLDKSVETNFLDVDLTTTSRLAYLEQLAKVTGLSLEMSEDSRRTLDLHVVAVHSKNTPLSILLDATLTPHELGWKQSGSRILIHPFTQFGTNFASTQTERLLKYALATAPEHTLAPICQIGLAAMKHQRGDLTGALREYERTMADSPQLPYASEIWVNVGKCRLALRNRDAIDAFYTAIDLGVGGLVEAVAQASIARIHMRNNAPNLAVIPLQQAEECIIKPTLKQQIRLELAAALLLDGQSQSSEKSLTRWLNNAANEEGRSQFILLAGLLNHLNTPEPQRRERDDVRLLAAISQLDVAKIPGEHWDYLKARAYHELGMQEEVDARYRAYSSKNSEFPLTARYRELITATEPAVLSSERFSLVEDSELETAIPLHDYLAGTSNKTGKNNAVIHFLENQLKKNTLSGRERQQTLRILGIIYQLQGEHELAVKCLTDGDAHPAANDSITPELGEESGR